MRRAKSCTWSKPKIEFYNFRAVDIRCRSRYNRLFETPAVFRGFFMPDNRGEYDNILDQICPISTSNCVSHQAHDSYLYTSCVYKNISFKNFFLHLCFDMVKFRVSASQKANDGHVVCPFWPHLRLTE